MMFYRDYSDIPRAVVDAFVQTQELGRLVTVGDDGTPHIGLYPFFYAGDTVDIHLHRADEQIADLGRRARCLFEVDEVLGTVPSYWVDPECAVMATAYHRSVIFECEAVVSADPALLAEQQMKLLARYQPEGGFRPVDPGDPMYSGAIDYIRSVRLAVVGRKAKFKLGQNRSPEVRAAVITELRKRGRPNDTRAADALQWTIDRLAASNEK